MQQRAGADHFRVQPRMRRQETVKLPAMPVGPLHHGCNAQSPLVLKPSIHASCPRIDWNLVGERVNSGQYPKSGANGRTRQKYPDMGYPESVGYRDMAYFIEKRPGSEASGIERRSSLRTRGELYTANQSRSLRGAIRMRGGARRDRLVDLIDLWATRPLRSALFGTQSTLRQKATRYGDM